MCRKDFEIKIYKKYCKECLKKYAKDSNGNLLSRPIWWNEKNRKNAKRKKKYKKNQSFFYIIEALEAIPNMIKVGRSKKPEKRIKDIDRGFPYELKTIFIGEESIKINEYKIHRKLRMYKIRREWFLYNDDTKKIIETMIQKYLDITLNLTNNIENNE